MNTTGLLDLKTTGECSYEDNKTDTPGFLENAIRATRRRILCHCLERRCTCFRPVI